MFSKRLKQLREENKLKQSDLATYIGVSIQAISNYENGREPNFEITGKIADFFNVSTDYLFGKTEFRNSDEEYFIRKNSGDFGLSLDFLDEEDAKIARSMTQSMLTLGKTLNNFDNKVFKHFYVVIRYVVDYYKQLLHFAENTEKLASSKHNEDIKNNPIIIKTQQDEYSLLPSAFVNCIYISDPASEKVRHKLNSNLDKIYEFMKKQSSLRKLPEVFNILRPTMYTDLENSIKELDRGGE